jgi:hypothetical protein
LGRVAPSYRLPLYCLAGAICLTRPYLGMHYPSDVLAGVVLGAAIGRAFPRLGERGMEERSIELGAGGAESRAADLDGAGTADARDLTPK